MSNVTNLNRDTTTPLALFDMDGTLLDLAFDHYIWMQRVPEIWAQQNNCDLEAAKQRLHQFYLENEGQLHWYSSKYWQQQLGVDVIALQTQHQDRIAPRPHCFALLEQLKAKNIECWLVTNADKATLALKLQTIALQPYFKHIISSEALGFAKEQQGFWQTLHQLHPFNAENSVLIDDNYHVLESGQNFGIGQLISILQPASSYTRQNIDTRFVHLDHLTDLVPLL